ncbi:GntR family transcriptional regulator [Variovorax sp.]|uniref:GntR family transcriptional regulator n=1 Tax=Variovorax sp. TaxID=1871043 RepID=UPI002D656BFA|nr:GntR family transcriptional regulator [Variovorax sp.]HYP83788.1 GntR family transcriptional regulator [Variovorax sp.]
MQDTTRATPLPLFARIEATLRQRILDRQLAAGDKLPSEAELEQEFGVSRITVRQALSALHANGFIRKVNGKGSFVTRPHELPQLGGLTGFYEHMRAKGRAAHGRTLSFRRDATAPPHAIRALRMAPGERVSALTTLRLVDGRPLAVGTSWGAPDLMEALRRQDTESNDIMTLLEGTLGHRLSSTHIETGATRAGKRRGALLEVPEDEPLLRICFTPHDMNDQPLTHSEMFFRGDQFSYRAIIRR